MVQDEVAFYGHPNVLSLHARTIEITKDGSLTPKGDCIVGVRANKACVDLDASVKRRLASNDSIVRVEIFVNNVSFVINGHGDARLTLHNAHDIVVRKTNFTCPRTLSIRCDKASSDMPRNMVTLLQDKASKGIFRITIE